MTKDHTFSIYTSSKYPKAHHSNVQRFNNISGLHLVIFYKKDKLIKIALTAGPFETAGDNRKKGSKLIKTFSNTNLEFFALLYEKCWDSGIIQKLYKKMDTK